MSAGDVKELQETISAPQNRRRADDNKREYEADSEKDWREAGAQRGTNES